jgi:hypothetical protein
MTIDLNAIKEAALASDLDEFYWEVGDVNGPIVSGIKGSLGSYDTPEIIASASKMLYAAYALEMGHTSKTDLSFCNMTSGYVSGKTINGPRLKVNECFDDVVTPSQVGKFYYSGGHMQKHATAYAGLGNLTARSLGKEVSRVLGVQISYSQALLAGGAVTSPQAYREFLLKILRNELVISKYLGVDAVCTLPKVCPTASVSPVDMPWGYSWGHWVEEDGTFSSAGAFGFYPWIDKTKTYYGLVVPKNRELIAKTSQKAGEAIRNALLDSVTPGPVVDPAPAPISWLRKLFSFWPFNR